MRGKVIGFDLNELLLSVLRVQKVRRLYCQLGLALHRIRLLNRSQHRLKWSRGQWPKNGWIYRLSLCRKAAPLHLLRYLEFEADDRLLLQDLWQ